jgi:TPP-dependent pyruvate/acetoin dehydrogenase alpha subunit
LENKNLWDEKKQAELEKQVKSEIDQAVKELEVEHDFKPDAPFDYVYGTQHEEIEQQRQEFLAGLKMEEKNG